jgi:hypothetical protein
MYWVRQVEHGLIGEVLAGVDVLGVSGAGEPLRPGALGAE